MSLEAWGDKWSLLIVRDLMFEGKRTYGEILNSREGMATNILAARLKSLQEHGIIVATKPHGMQVGNGYALTKKGIELLPVMIEIYLWTEKHYTIPNEIKETLKTVKADKEGFIATIAKDLENLNQSAAKPSP